MDLKGSLELGGRGSDVQLESIAGPVTIKGEFSGTLEFRALAKPLEFTSSRTEFRVEAIPGEITMDLGDLKMNNVSGPVRFESQTRDIQITDVTELLDLKVDRGDIGVTSTHAPLPKMDIHTRNGDINLTLPEHAGFQLDGSTSQGDISSGFGSSLRIDSSGHSATIRGQNGSGPQITVNTDRGTVFSQEELIMGRTVCRGASAPLPGLIHKQKRIICVVFQQRCLAFLSPTRSLQACRRACTGEFKLAQTSRTS